MIHRVAGRKLGRTSNQRKALFRSLANSFILHEKIVTTDAKAKAVRPMIEKLITLAKTNSIVSRRLLLKDLVSENTVQKMLEVIGPKFKERPGGYTRIVKMGNRSGDQAAMVSLTFVEDFAVLPIKTVDKEIVENKTKEDKKPAKKKTSKKIAVKEKDGNKDKK